MDTILKFIALNANGEWFVTDNLENASWHNPKITNYEINGEVLTKTYDRNWFRVNGMPVTVMQKSPDVKVNMRYELKPAFITSGKFPQRIECDVFDPNADIAGLYDLKFDIEAGIMVPVKFEMDVISKDSKFIDPPKYKYTRSIIESMLAPEILSQFGVCIATSSDLFDLFVNLCKTRLDKQVAYVKYEASGVIEIAKYIKLVQPIEYKINTNAGSRRKPKYVVRYRTADSVTCFSANREKKDGLFTPITANSYEELETKVDQYMDDLFTQLNEPLCACNVCGGEGYVKESAQITI